MPPVPASPRRRVKLAGFLVATALALGGCGPKWSSARIPTYEPMPVDISGFPNAADKAKLAEIARFMRERLIARQVDAPHANAVLWQFHYFAPVRYLDDDCASYIDIPGKEKFKNEDEQIGRMGEAAKDVFDRYDKKIPYSKLADGARYNAEQDISGKDPYNLSNGLEFWEYPPSVNCCYQSMTISNEEERYYEENRKIYDEIYIKNHSRIPQLLLKYHIRNFIINLIVTSMNVMHKNGEVAERFKDEAAGFGKSFYIMMEYNYQLGAGKSVCRR